MNKREEAMRLKISSKIWTIKASASFNFVLFAFHLSSE